MSAGEECAMPQVVCPSCDSENDAPMRKQTVFETIMQSLEALAKSSVYCLSLDLCRADDGKFTVKRNWTSPFIDRCYDTEEAAIAATLARLKESVEVEPAAN